MLEQCDFMELTEEVLQQCKGFTCKDDDITEFFTQDYVDYAYQLLGKSYCFVKPDTSEMVSSSCFRQMRKNGLFGITKVKRQQLR